MRFRLALALLISILLVVTASWSRFGTTNYAPSIATLEQIQTDNEYYSDDSFIRDFLKPSTASTTLPAEPLSNTELIGRQLILDYIGLATSGQATEANIDAVANKYLESIPKLIKTQKISRSDIKIVPDNNSNFQNYADQILKIHREYAAAFAGLIILNENLDKEDVILNEISNILTANGI